MKWLNLPAVGIAIAVIYGPEKSLVFDRGHGRAPLADSGAGG
jgi:hypothetical protein